MGLLVANIQWVMLAGGLITASMLLAAAAPRFLFQIMFAETPEGPLGDLLARHWGVLIALTAGMLLWGAFHPEVRTLVLVMVSISKLSFVALTLRVPAYRARALVPVVVDLVLVALFVAWLAAA